MAAEGRAQSWLTDHIKRWNRGMYDSLKTVIEEAEQAAIQRTREGIRDACYAKMDKVYDDYESAGLAMAAELAMTTPKI